MTTIALKDGVLAADKQANSDDGFKSECTKLFRLKDGGMVVVCGDLYAAGVFVDWLNDRRRRKPDLDNESDFEAIVVTGKGAVATWSASLRPLPVVEPFMAIGSGAAVALGAMHCGATAKHAVEVACKVDQNSGLGVDTMTIEPARKLKC